MTRKYTPAETACILQQKLGNLRSWERFLAHCIGGREGGPGKLGGLVLLPGGYDLVGRTKLPRYLTEDLARFIAAVWELRPETRSPHELGTITTAPIGDGRPWFMKPLSKKAGVLPHTTRAKTAAEAGLTIH